MYAYCTRLRTRRETTARGRAGIARRATMRGTAGVVAQSSSFGRTNEGFRNWVRFLPETIGVFVVAGNADLLIHVAVSGNDRLYAFVIDRLTERDEGADVQTSIVYEHLRSHVIEPMMSLRL